MRLLLLEDDQRLCGAFARSLRAAGHAVDEVHTLFAADEAANRVDFDCLVLDRKVPGGDGMELVRRVRKEGGDVPILVLSAMAEVEDRLEGLEGGADDYLTKPVELRELVLRVSKLARGGLQRSRSTLVRVGRVTMNRPGFVGGSSPWKGWSHATGEVTGESDHASLHRPGEGASGQAGPPGPG